MQSSTLFPWQHRWLFLNLFERELKNRYLGSSAALIWVFLQPLLLLAVFSFVFTQVFRAPVPTGSSYVVFVAVALWPWLAFHEALLRGTKSVQAHGDLIRKVAFPHELLVYSSVAVTFCLHLIGYVVVLLVLSWIFPNSLHLVGVFGAASVWLTLALAACGITLILAAMQVVFPDLEQILPPILNILLYCAPILYPMQMVPASIQPLMHANPFTHVAERLREQLLGGSPLWAPTDLLMIIVALVLIAGGIWVFRRLSPYFEDFL